MGGIPGMSRVTLTGLSWHFNPLLSKSGNATPERYTGIWFSGFAREFYFL